MVGGSRAGIAGSYLYQTHNTLHAFTFDEQSFYNILLVVAIVMTYAVDTSICERGFALMNNLKTARRSRMGNLLLRALMTICELGADWEDPSKILVDEIVEEWRAQSKRGRYESAMWRTAGLEEPLAGSASAPAPAPLPLPTPAPAPLPLLMAPPS